MNGKILKQIPLYLPANPDDIIKDEIAKNDPCLLHADLTDENLLGTLFLFMLRK